MEHEWSSSSCALHALRLLLTPFFFLSSKFIYPLFDLANEKSAMGAAEKKKKKNMKRRPKTPRGASFTLAGGAAK